MNDEKVMVFPASLLDRFGRARGFVPCSCLLGKVLASGEVGFRERGEVEGDPFFKQVATYSIVHRSGRMSESWSYRRRSGEGESRLLGKRSIGVGGHVSIDDFKETPSPTYPNDDDKCDHLWRTIRNAAVREVREELDVPGPDRLSFLGTVNDDSDDVGAVHFGVVFAYVLPDGIGDIISASHGGSRSWFLSGDDLTRMRYEYESWSRLIMDSQMPW